MPQEDPVVRSGRREAAFAFGLWLVALVYVTTVCYVWGYRPRTSPLTFVLWFPDWVFWGIVVPWCACILIGTWFAFRAMRNEPLEDEAAEAPPDARVDHA